MKNGTLKRMTAAALAMSVAAALLPQALAAVPSSANWTVEPFGTNAFGLYRHTSADDWQALKIQNGAVDLSDAVHFYIGDNQVTYCGFAMMRADNGEVPVKGAAITDEGYYELICSNSQGYNGTYFYPQGAEMIFVDGRAQQYEDGTSVYTKGMPLKYRAGGAGSEYYIEPGDYRFVYFKRQSRSITYSEVYHITDNNGLYTDPGSMDVSFTVRGESSPTAHLYSDDIFDLELSGFTASDGSAADMSGATVKQLDFVTNSSSYGIPTSGESLDSLVSYSFNKAKTMYDTAGMNKGRYTDGRTVETGKNYVTLKGATGSYLAYGSDMTTLTEWDTQYICRVKLIAEINGEDRIFYNTSPVLFTPAATEVTIYNTKLENGVTGIDYSMWLDGRAPDRSKLTWTVADGSELPSGLMLSEDGHITGTARAAGTFNVTLKAEAANGESAEKTFSNWTFEKRSGTGSWLMSADSSSYYRNAQTDLKVCAKPMQEGVIEGTPSDGTQLTFSCSGITNESEVTMISPASGVSAQVSGSSVYLTFDGSAYVDSDGIVFEVSKVKNPDDPYNSLSFYGRWTTDCADMSMNDQYLPLPLYSADGVMVTVNDWDKYKDMDLRLTVTADGKEESTVYFYDGLAVIPNLGIDAGESFSVKLEARDALWKWYEYYNGSFTGDGEGNPVSITPDPEVDLKGYEFNVTFGGEAYPDRVTNGIELSKAGNNGSIYKIGHLTTQKGYQKKYFLADVDGLSAKVSSRYTSGRFVFSSDTWQENYDETGRITVNGNAVNIDFPLLEQSGRISGKVTDGNGSPVQGASVVAAQDINGSAYTMNVITDAQGVFSISGLFGGHGVELTAWASGFGETAVSADVNSSDVEITLQRTGRIYINIADGQSVTDAIFRINGLRPFKFTSGSSFTLDLPEGTDTTEGASYEVNMTSSDTFGSVKGTAVFDADGTAALSLSPERMGALDWSGISGAGFYINVYKNNNKYCSFAASEMTGDIPAGEYTVWLSADTIKKDGDPSENITVGPGETAYVSIEPAETDNVITASVNAPKTAAKESLYTISGVITSASDKDGRDLSGISISGLGKSEAEGCKINGKYSSDRISARNGTYTIDLAADGELSFPLDYTVYIRQKNPEGAYATAGVSAIYTDRSTNDKNVISIGSIKTRSVPNITIGCQEMLGSRTETVNIGGSKQEAIMPDAVSFSGTAPADGTVRIYDNDNLAAVVKTDKNGRYSGRTFPADASRTHTLRAEYSVSDDEIISADITYTYIPAAPVMKSLWLIHQGKKYPLAINGASTAYSWNPHSNYFTYEASIENDENLEWMTVNISSDINKFDEVRGKVFFLVTTKDGGTYTLPASKNPEGNWQSETNVRLGDSAPVGVKVLYRGATEKRAPAVSVEGEGELVDGSGTPLIDDSLMIALRPGFTSTWDDKKDILKLLGISADDRVENDLGYEENGIWTDIYPEEDENPDRLTAANEDTAAEQRGDPHLELAADGKTMSDLFESIAVQLGDPAGGMVDDPEDPDFETKDGVKEFTAINITDAQKRSGKYYEQRTWTDEPTWTEDGLNKRLETMKALGYKSYYTVDPESGREFIYLRGTFYYDRYGDPVPSLYVTNTYSGIQRSEVSDRILNNGELIGSMLDVKYLYDVEGKKWVRMQSVMMPPNVTSPIHTSRNQIPCGSERALRYTPAEDIEYSIASDNRKRNGGLQMKVRLSKVSEKTVSGYALSIAAFGLGKGIDANKTLTNYVDITNRYGKYQLGILSNVNTSLFTGLGQLTGSGAKGTSAPQNNIDMDTLRKLLEKNYEYYSKLDGGVYHITSEYGREATKKILKELGDIEYDVAQAGIQDVFTQKVTDQLTFASLGIGLFGSGYGTVGSFVADTISAYISAANDTNNEEVAEKLIGFRQKLESYLNNDRSSKDRMMKSEQKNIDYNKKIGFDVYSIETNVFNDPFGGGASGSDELEKKKKPSGGGGGGTGGGDEGGGTGGGDEGGGTGGGDTGTDAVNPTNPTSQHNIDTTPVADPSGIVYEGVIENPVEGATVTIYSYDSETGMPVMHDDSIYLNQENPILTDENGHYGWDVPEGEWYVKAEKEGYSSGSSTNDAAAVRKHEVNGEEMSFLPVLPVQLDVNIPLVDASAPEIENVRYTNEGVYITFSKYMVDSAYDGSSVLDNGSYTLADKNGPVSFGVESIERGHAPGNIDSRETTYSKTVLLKPYSTTLTGEVTLSVSGTIKSYAGTAMGRQYSETAQTEPVAYMDNRVLLALEDINSVSVLHASYDENGRLIRVTNQPATGTGTVEVPDLEAGDRLFVWDSLRGMRPLAESYTAE